MDNIITSALLQSISLAASGKGLSAVLEELPQGIKAGDMLLLQTIINSDTFQSGDLFKLTWQPEQGQPQDINVRLSAPLRLSGEVGEVRQFAARVMSDGSLQLQQLKLQPTVSDTAPSAAISSKVDSALPHITFQPVKVAAVVDNLMTSMQFPPALKNVVVQSLPPAEIMVVLKGLNPDLPAEDGILAPLKETLNQMLPMANKPQQIAPLVQKLAQDIQALNGQVFDAKPAATQMAANPISIFDSPIGKILSEQPVKLPSETVLRLGVENPPEGEKIFAEFPLLKNIAETLAKVLPEDGFVRIESHTLLQAARNQDTAAIKFLKVFEPLQDNPQIASAVLQKFAGIKADVLQNIYSFYKAAGKFDVSKWLGPELTAKIIAEAPRGSETIARIDAMLANSVRETPLWRVIEVPFFDGGRILPLQIALKKEPEEEGKKDKRSKGGTRFMINVEFSKLGAFQFDGFSVVAERRFDLLIRTEKNHPQDFCSHIINLFKKSLYDVGYVGTIKINQREAFIRIEAAAEPKEGLYV